MATKYRNPREEAEMLSADEDERHEEIMKVEPKNVEDAGFKKRYDDSRRGFEDYKRKRDAETEELRAKLDAALRGQIKAPRSKEEVSEWIKKYPEFAGILETFVEDRINSRTSVIEEKQSRIEERQRELDKNEALLALKRRHSDFDALVKDEAFHKWLSEQPRRYQDAMYNGLDVDEASFVLDKYKLQNKVKSSKVEEEDFDYSDAAKVVRNSSVAHEAKQDFGDYDFTESQIEKQAKINPRWFEKNEEKIMEAMRKGRVYMDVSGGAQ